MSDGFLGKKNVYMCDCGYGFVTLDADKGTTPFMTGCLREGCNNLARSFMYQVPQEILASVEPAAEWYRPGFADLRLMSANTQNHVRNGGLILRKLDK